MSIASRRLLNAETAEIAESKSDYLRDLRGLCVKNSLLHSFGGFRVFSVRPTARGASPKKVFTRLDGERILGQVTYLTNILLFISKY